MHIVYSPCFGLISSYNGELLSLSLLLRNATHRTGRNPHKADSAYENTRERTYTQKERWYLELFKKAEKRDICLHFPAAQLRRMRNAARRK